MNKRNQVEHLLHLLSEKCTDILDEEDGTGLSILSASEVVGLAIDIVTRDQFNLTNKKYSSPVGQVQRNFVHFSIGDDFELPLQPEEEDDTN